MTDKSVFNGASLAVLVVLGVICLISNIIFSIIGWQVDTRLLPSPAFS